MSKKRKYMNVKSVEKLFPKVIITRMVVCVGIVIKKNIWKNLLKNGRKGVI